MIGPFLTNPNSSIPFREVLFNDINQLIIKVMISVTLFVVVVLLLLVVAIGFIYRFSEHSLETGYRKGCDETTDKYRALIDAKDQTIADQRQQLVDACKPGHFSDGYHTFDELYYYRMSYNSLVAALITFIKKHPFNSPKFQEIDVIKSKKHFGGELCYGGGWFVVMIKTPFGQISNNYKMEYWDNFDCRATKQAWKWDGHTMKESNERIFKLIKYLNQR